MTTCVEGRCERLGAIEAEGGLCVGAVLDRRLPFRRALPEEQIALAAHVNASRWCSPSRTQRNASRQPLRASLQRGTPRCQGQRRTGTQRTRCLCISCTAPSPRRPDEQSQFSGTPVLFLIGMIVQPKSEKHLFVENGTVNQMGLPGVKTQFPWGKGG